MPKIKTRRQDILRPGEIMEAIEKAKSEGYPWLACAMAIGCMYGKRIIEILSLKKEQFLIDERFLTIRFRVGKKRDKDTPIPIYHLKRKTLKHSLMPYVLDYLRTCKEGYIFPFNRSEQVVKQNVMIKTNNGEIKELHYEYKVPGGFISRQLANYYLKKIAPSWWWHLCRESLATSMAEKGATEEELMHWFDWETPASPHKYVKRGTKLTEKWAEETW